MLLEKYDTYWYVIYIYIGYVVAWSSAPIPATHTEPVTSQDSSNRMYTENRNKWVKTVGIPDCPEPYPTYSCWHLKVKSAKKI